MARILVAADEGRFANAQMASRLRRLVEEDGHEAAVLGADVPRFVADADAVIALLDSSEPDPWATAALVAAACLRKPTLAVTNGRAPDFVAACADQVVTARSEQALQDALPGFYQDIRPFAGRLVRDRIPELVKEAGHEVTFRQVDKQELPRFLKQKINKEAEDLRSADLGSEKEEIGDLLEALEALIRTRGFDREDLKRIKEGKRKRRGGFERGFVVETTTRPDDQAPERSAEDGDVEETEASDGEIPEVAGQLSEADVDDERTPIFEA